MHLRTYIFASIPFLITTAAYSQESEEVVQLQPLTVVSSSTLASPADLPFAVARMDAGELADSARPSVGETLDGLPGVTSSQFAPGASRPIIRGQEGERVRVLENALEGFDVSQTSPDHGLGIEPLLAGDIEVLRGPGTLLYGGNAIGGVVSVDNMEIPFDALASSGVTLFTGAQGSSGTRGGALASRVTVPLAGSQLRLQGAWRNDGDYVVPDDFHLPEEADEHDHGEGEDEHDEHAGQPDRLPGSFARTRYGSGAWATGWTGGHAGLSSSIYRSEYGVPAHFHGEEHEHEHEEDDEDEHAHEDEEHEHSVSIRLQRIRHTGELLLEEPLAGLKSIKLTATAGDYWHEELEGDEVATRFERDGWESRLEALHGPLFGMEGMVGVSASRLSFSAEGEESFAPASYTDNRALFVIEEWRWADLWVQAGGRLEHQEVDPDGVPGDYSGSAPSASIAVSQGFSGWRAGLVASLASRHPSSTELFADGPHAAVARYEVGDSSLGVEHARSMELSLRRTTGRITGYAQIYLADYEDYIFLRDTSETSGGFQVARFEHIDARFRGAEAEASVILINNGPGVVSLSLGGDTVLGRDRDSGDRLPRIPASRIWTGLTWEQPGHWSVSTRLRHNLEQDSTAPGEEATDAYSTVDVRACWSPESIPNLHLAVGVLNVFDELGFNHASFIKHYTPIRGRSLELAVSISL